MITEPLNTVDYVAFILAAWLLLMALAQVVLGTGVWRGYQYGLLVVPLVWVVWLR